MNPWVFAGWALVIGLVLELISIFVVTPQKKMPFEKLYSQIKAGDLLSSIGRFLIGLALLAAFIGLFS